MNCYNCNCSLNKRTKSIEHIIPNAIGGTLKSDRLLCRQCNNEFGLTIDAALANDFEYLAAFLNIERDRPREYQVKNIKASDEDVPYLEMERNRSSIKPEIKFGKDQVFISGCDKKQAIQIVSGLKRKYPDIDLDSLEQKISDDDTFLNETLTIDVAIGSELLMRAIAKIAVNYYLMKTRGRRHLDRIVNIINGLEENDRDIHYYYLPDDTSRDKEISHVIIVKGDRTCKTLYVHLILFGTYSYIVHLCDDYDGDDINYFYRYDVLSRQEIKDKFEMNYNRREFLSEIQTNPAQLNEMLLSSLQNGLARMLDFTQQHDFKPGLERFLNSTFSEAISKYPEGPVMTREIEREVHDLILDRAADFLKHTH